jgi:hypothetical protein
MFRPKQFTEITNSTTPRVDGQCRIDRDESSDPLDVLAYFELRVSTHHNLENSYQADVTVGTPNIPGEPAVATLWVGDSLDLFQQCFTRRTPEFVCAHIQVILMTDGAPIPTLSDD